MRNFGVTTAQVDRLYRDIGEAEAIRDELVAEHHGGNLEQFEAYADDPVGFQRDVLGARYVADYQREHAESVRDNPRTVVRGAHAIGKEWEAARLALWAAYARGMLVLIISQTQRQVLGQTMRELADAFLGAPDLPGELLTGSLRINGRPRVIALTGGSRVDSLTGYHDPAGVLVIVTEGQGEQLEDVAYDAAFANATDDRSRILALGNPVRPAGRFYEINQRDNWRAFRVSAFDHPNLIHDREVIPGGPTRRWVDDVAAEYGTDSAYYTSRVLADFPTQGADALIRREWIDAATRKHAAGLGDGKDKALRLVVDPAGDGPDETVVGFVHGVRLDRFETWSRKSAEETVQRIHRIATHEAKLQRSRNGRRARSWIDGAGNPRRLTLPNVTIDAIGIGWTMAGWLRGRGLSVSDYKGSRQARNPDKFESKRAESYWTIRESLQAGFKQSDGGLTIPADTKLIDDLLALTWGPGTRDKVSISTKDEVRATLGRSPDRGDVVAMALGGSRPPTAAPLHFD